MSTVIDTVLPARNKVVRRCPHCELNQFVTLSTQCRKCKKNLFSKPVDGEHFVPELEWVIAAKTLTPDELKVRDMLLDGKRLQQIAIELGVPYQSAKNRASSVYKKMGVTNHEGLLALYLLPFDSPLRRKI